MTRHQPWSGTERHLGVYTLYLWLLGWGSDWRLRHCWYFHVISCVAADLHTLSRAYCMTNWLNNFIGCILHGCSAPLRFD